MREAMWFVLGLLWGGAAVCAMGYIRRSVTTSRPDVEKLGRDGGNPQKEWVQTRNFLYYDGTEMPVVKEDLNEQ